MGRLLEAFISVCALQMIAAKIAKTTARRTVSHARSLLMILVRLKLINVTNDLMSGRGLQLAEVDCGCGFEGPVGEVTF